MKFKQIRKDQCIDIHDLKWPEIQNKITKQKHRAKFFKN